jgi:hypothetical protein
MRAPGRAEARLFARGQFRSVNPQTGNLEVFLSLAAPQRPPPARGPSVSSEGSALGVVSPSEHDHSHANRVCVLVIRFAASIPLRRTSLSRRRHVERCSLRGCLP